METSSAWRRSPTSTARRPRAGRSGPCSAGRRGGRRPGALRRPDRLRPARGGAGAGQRAGRGGQGADRRRAGQPRLRIRPAGRGPARSSPTRACILLDGDACEVHGVGFAGVKGFAGGFGRGTLGAVGRAGRSSVRPGGDRRGAEAGDGPGAAADAADGSPCCTTRRSGRPSRASRSEIFPFLGCSRLEEPLNRYPVTAVFHGHAHHGSPEGRTAGGIPVYNVALPAACAGPSPTGRRSACLEIPATPRPPEAPAGKPSRPGQGRPLPGRQGSTTSGQADARSAKSKAACYLLRNSIASGRRVDYKCPLRPCPRPRDLKSIEMAVPDRGIRTWTTRTPVIARRNAARTPRRPPSR